MRNFLPFLLYLALLAILPTVAYAHGSNVFESDKPLENVTGQHTHTGHAADATTDEFEELHDEIAHLEERLIAHDQRVRMTDIVGGIGYIVGITGAAYYYLGGRKRKQQ